MSIATRNAAPAPSPRNIDDAPEVEPLPEVPEGDGGAGEGSVKLDVTATVTLTPASAVLAVKAVSVAVLTELGLRAPLPVSVLTAVRMVLAWATGNTYVTVDATPPAPS
jgi:hypothetical protein